MPWIGLKNVVAILSDHTCITLQWVSSSEFDTYHKGSDETAHLRSLARAFENRAKIWDIDEGSAIFYRPVQESLVVVAYVSSEGSGETAHLRSLARAFENRAKILDIDEGSAQFYRPVQENLVLVAFASSEGSGETAHSCSLARAFANHTKKKG